MVRACFLIIPIGIKLLIKPVLLRLPSLTPSFNIILNTVTHLPSHTEQKVKDPIFWCRGCHCMPDLWHLPKVVQVVSWRRRPHHTGYCLQLFLINWLHSTSDSISGQSVVPFHCWHLFQVTLLLFQSDQLVLATPSLWPLRLIYALCLAFWTICSLIMMCQTLFDNWLIIVGPFKLPTIHRYWYALEWLP